MGNQERSSSLYRANRLLSVDGTNYRYDGDGQRIRQTVGGTVTEYLVDAAAGLPVVVQATRGADVTRSVHAVGGVLSEQNPDGAWEWLLRDGLGSVRSVTDAVGAVLETVDYSPYGVPNAALTQTAYGFTGEMTDTNGRVYLRARYYHPTMGTFPTLDPFEGAPERPLSLHGYSWVEGNTVNATDPTGEQAFIASLFNNGMCQPLPPCLTDPRNWTQGVDSVFNRCRTTPEPSLSTAAGIGAIALAPELGKALGVLAIDVVALSAAAAGGLLAAFGAAVVYTAINSPWTGIDPRIKPAPTPDVDIRVTEQPYYSRETILAPTLAPDWLIPVPVATPAPYYDVIRPWEKEEEIVIPTRLPEMRVWKCTTNCSVIGPTPPCGFHISGTGIGSTQHDACDAAKANANSQLTRQQFDQGCRIKHCPPCTCTK